MEKGFFEKVYELVKKIPKGRVLTYGMTARMLGYPGKAIIVGWALHSNPYKDTVPCHRIVDRNGNVSGSFAFGGSCVQRRLLEDEGIIFKSDGSIDLERYLWK